MRKKNTKLNGQNYEDGFNLRLDSTLSKMSLI